MWTSSWSKLGSLGSSLNVFETTIEVRPGNGRTELGKEDHVRRPMISTWPMVICLKCCRSSGTSQGIPPSKPMTPSRLCARVMPSAALDGNWSFDGGVVLVFNEFEIFQCVTEQVFWLTSKPQLGVRIGLA